MGRNRNRVRILNQMQGCLEAGFLFSTFIEHPLHTKPYFTGWG